MQTTTGTNDTGLSPLLVDRETARVALGGVSPAHLRNLVRRGDIPAVHVGRRVMFRVSDLAAYVDQLQHTA